MTKLYSVLRLEMKRIYSRNNFLILSLALPIMLSFFVTYVVTVEDSVKIPIIVVDEDMSNLSSLLIDYISESDGLKLIKPYRESPYDLLRASKVEGLYIINNGFENSILSNNTPLITVVKSINGIGNSMVSEVVAAEVIRIMMGRDARNAILNLAQESDVDDFIASKESFFLEVPIVINSKNFNEKSSQIDNKIGFSAGPVGIIIMFSILSTGYMTFETFSDFKNQIKTRFSLTNSENTVMLSKDLSIVISGSLSILFNLVILKILKGIDLNFGLTILSGVLLSYIICQLAKLILFTTKGTAGYVIFLILGVFLSILSGVVWSYDILNPNIRGVFDYSPLRKIYLAIQNNSYANLRAPLIWITFLFITERLLHSKIALKSIFTSQSNEK